MIIRLVRAINFMAHDELTIDLPDTGVVLITGPNGAGKSAIIEACAHALFGKSVRGEWGWRDVPEAAASRWRSSVNVRTDRVDVTRSKRKGSPVLSWAKEVAGAWHPDTSDNTTKAQASLERVVGGYDLWLRSHVFSSGDAAHFTLATDAKRKRFLEAMLGIEYFDTALERARRALATTKEKFAEASQRSTALEAKLAIVQAGIATANDMLAQPAPVVVVPPHPGDLVLPTEPVYPALGEPPEPPAPPQPLPAFDPGAPDPAVAELRKSLAAIEANLADVAEDLGDARTSERAYRRDFTVARGKLEAARSELAKWPGGVCPTCEQPVSEEKLGPLTGKAKAAEAEALAQAQDATRAVEVVESELDTLEKHRVHLEAEATKLREEITRIDAKRQEKIEARGELERRYNDDVARCEVQRRQIEAQHTAAHRDRVAALRQRWEAECVSAKREHEIRVSHHETVKADAVRMQAEHEKTRLHYQAELTRLTTEKADIESALIDVESSVVTLHSEQAELEAMEDVFGLKGVRANVLGNALSGLETLANDWLQRIGKPGQQLRLREYTEKDKGGNTPALSLELMHLGRPVWHRYKACSQGERRRVDVALILALAEVGRAVHGRSRGTLFFDEVFDALDKDGVAKVTDVIHDLGADRCVVVISHNLDLVSRLNPTLHLQMEGREEDDDNDRTVEAVDV